MTDLWIASLAFVGSHFILSASFIRSRLIDMIGEWPFLGAYSFVAGGTLWWMITAYTSAPDIELWSPHIALRHLAISVMPLVCVLLIAGYTSGNPTAVGFSVFKGLQRGPAGIFRVSRHPILWGVGLWALTHLLANGNSADMVFFGAMAVLALGGARHMDERKRRELGEAWGAYRAETSSVPFLAIIQGRQKFVLSEIRLWRILAGLVLYVAMLVMHQTVTGVSPLPMP